MPPSAPTPPTPLIPASPANPAVPAMPPVVFQSRGEALARNPEDWLKDILDALDVQAWNAIHTYWFGRQCDTILRLQSVLQQVESDLESIKSYASRISAHDPSAAAQGGRQNGRRLGMYLQLPVEQVLKEIGALVYAFKDLDSRMFGLTSSIKNVAEKVANVDP